MDAFEGLLCLNELILRSNNTDSLPPAAFNILSRYNTLTMLNASIKQISGNFTLLWEQLCNISSLQAVDFSCSGFYGDTKPVIWTCSPTNLKILNIGYQKDLTVSANICQVATQLEALDFSGNSVDFYQTNCTCYHLVTLVLTKCDLIIDPDAQIYLPILQELYLNNLVYVEHSLLTEVLNALKTPHLGSLNLRQNGIYRIDDKLGRFFINLTHLDLGDNYIRTMNNANVYFSGLEYLNLENNRVKSISSLQTLHNLRILLLNDNTIPTVPKTMDSASDPFYDMKILEILDLNNNPFQCDCNLEAFRNWILTDDIIYLKTGIIESHYQCFSPDPFQNMSITQISLNCESHLWDYASIVITCCVIVLISVILIAHFRHICQNLYVFIHNKGRSQYLVIQNDDNRIDDGDEIDNDDGDSRDGQRIST